MPSYLKPELPQGWFMLVDERGYDEGPFSDAMLTQVTDGSEAWALVGEGRPNVLRVIQQDGDMLVCERQGATYRLQIKRVEEHDDQWVYVQD